MTASEWLGKAQYSLKEAGVGTARLDCLVLLEDETHKNRAWLLAHPEFELSSTQLTKLNKKVARRAKHEPLAYIRGYSEFYGRRFKVNNHVLEPRPESETMIDLLVKLPLNSQAVIADIGTGSGALGITAALELHTNKVDLYDIDSSALGVAKNNVALHELHLKTYKRNLLNRPARDYDVLLANLPYVPRYIRLNQAAEMEPKIAIDGGSDGLDLYRKFFEQLRKLEKPPKYVLTEAMPPQHKALAGIARSASYKQLKKSDFIQLFSF